MSHLRMPAVVRLLMCAALAGTVSAGTLPSGRTADESNTAAADELPTMNSFSGYIIAVG